MFLLYNSSVCTASGLIHSSLDFYLHVGVQKFLAQREATTSHRRVTNSDKKARSPARPIFFPMIDDSHCDRIHSSLTGVHCFDSGYVGKQPVAWTEYCAEYWLKELQESMDWCTGRHDITEVLLSFVENGIKHHTINTILGKK